MKQNQKGHKRTSTNWNPSIFDSSTKKDVYETIDIEPYGFDGFDNR